MKTTFDPDQMSPEYEAELLATIKLQKVRLWNESTADVWFRAINGMPLPAEMSDEQTQMAEVAKAWSAHQQFCADKLV